MRSISVIAHDIRSAHNVGSLLRTCEGLGVDHVYLTGYTPYPMIASGDTRLPHISTKLSKQIHKTALDAELIIPWSHDDDIYACLSDLRSNGYRIVALEQSDGSIPLTEYSPYEKMILLLGREVEGIDSALLSSCDDIIEIPMLGKKESFNVVQAAAIALFALRFTA